MADADDKQVLELAFANEPKPITGKRVREIVAKLIDARKAAQFEEWLKVHESVLLRRLNG